MTSAENPANVERDLASRLARGDPAAVVELVERYTDDLYRFVYHQVGGATQDAEDIVQETLVAALSAISRFRGESKLRTWLFSIAAHKITDWQRRSGRSPKLAPLEDFSSVLHTDSPQPDQAVEKLEFRQGVRQALLQLPPHYRAALVLKYVEEMPVQEIGQVMRRSVKSVESILVRARRLFSEILGNEGEQDGA